MMQLILPEHRAVFAPELEEMHRLRCRVFRDRLDWSVEAHGGLEVDRFDELGPAYLLRRGDDGMLQGCVRLLPTEGPTMLGEVFSELLDGQPEPNHPQIWESSRLALDLSAAALKIDGCLSQATIELFLGMIEFGLAWSLVDIVTVTDTKIERLLNRARWPLRRLSEPKQIGNSQAVAGFLEVSVKSWTTLRRLSGIRTPVLWGPVVDLPQLHVDPAD
jgi:acyl homoserine lactone synthase